MRGISETHSQGLVFEIESLGQKILIGLFTNGDPLTVVHFFVEKGEEELAIDSRTKAEIAAELDFLGNLHIGRLRLWLECIVLGGSGMWTGVITRWKEG